MSIRFRPGAVDVIFGIILVLLFFQQLDLFASDPGLGWHLKSGEVMIETRAVPVIDPFLVTESPKRWISDQWLSDLVFASLYSWGGWKLLYFFGITLFICTYFVILPRFVHVQTGTFLPAAISSVLACKLSTVHFILRPVLFSFFLFALLLSILFSIEKDRILGKRSSLLRWTLVPILCFIWANLHPSFVLGLLTILFLPFGLLLDSVFFSDRKIGTSTLNALLLLFIVSCGATLLNPNGYELHKSILELGRSTFFMTLHSEWRPISFASPEGRILEVMLAVLFLGILFGLKRKSEAEGFSYTFFEILLLGFFLHQTLQSVRFAPYFSLAASLPIAKALSNCRNISFPSSDGPFARSKRMLITLEEGEAGRANGTMAVCSAFIVMFASFFGSGSLLSGGKDFGPSRAVFPYGAVEMLSRQRENTKVLSSPDWGGFITFHGWPKVRPFFDDRNTLLGEGVYREILPALKNGDKMGEFAKKLGATHILISTESGASKTLSGSATVREIYRDGISVLYELSN